MSDTVFVADEYTVREAEVRAKHHPEIFVRFLGDGIDTRTWYDSVFFDRSGAVAKAIDNANVDIARGQEACRALARLKRDPDAPGADAVGEPDRTTLTVADFSAVDAAIAIPVTVVDDDEADIDPDSTDLYEPDQGEPVASRLEPAGSANDRVPYHGAQS